ncbi:MAG: hypothetical protein ACLFPQ_03845 [Candidatus Woesearchaeota archaeon]
MDSYQKLVEIVKDYAPKIIDMHKKHKDKLEREKSKSLLRKIFLGPEDYETYEKIYGNKIELSYSLSDKGQLTNVSVKGKESYHLNDTYIKAAEMIAHDLGIKTQTTHFFSTSFLYHDNLDLKKSVGENKQTIENIIEAQKRLESILSPEKKEEAVDFIYRQSSS